eukprot:4734103-Pleurochrysis_carterae.AAC.2
MATLLARRWSARCGWRLARSALGSSERKETFSSKCDAAADGATSLPSGWPRWASALGSAEVAASEDVVSAADVDVDADSVVFPTKRISPVSRAGAPRAHHLHRKKTASFEPFQRGKALQLAPRPISNVLRDLKKDHQQVADKKGQESCHNESHRGEWRKTARKWQKGEKEDVGIDAPVGDDRRGAQAQRACSTARKQSKRTVKGRGWKPRVCTCMTCMRAWTLVCAHALACLSSPRSAFTLADFLKLPHKASRSNRRTLGIVTRHRDLPPVDLGVEEEVAAPGQPRISINLVARHHIMRMLVDIVKRRLAQVEPVLARGGRLVLASASAASHTHRGAAKAVGRSRLGDAD